MKLLYTLSLISVKASDLMGTDQNSESTTTEAPSDGPSVRHIGSTRNMIYELSELNSNPLNFFSSKPNQPGLVYPRDLIKNHGCYCHYEGCDGTHGLDTTRQCTKGISPRISDYFGMPFKTPLDKNCHKMHRAHTCLQSELQECNDMRRNYGWRMENGEIYCNEKRNDNCQQALCKIDKQFAESVVEMVRSDPDEVRSWLDNFDFVDVEDFNQECPRPPKVPQPLDSEGECCGLGIERAFYRRIPALSECCIEKDSNGDVMSEEVRPLGMCF